jgi:hypothetical protein
MNVILEKIGVPFRKSSDFGVISYTFDLEGEDLKMLQDNDNDEDDNVSITGDGIELDGRVEFN